MTGRSRLALLLACKCVAIEKKRFRRSPRNICPEADGASLSARPGTSVKCTADETPAETLAAQIDNGSAVLRLADARPGGHQRIMEALALDRDCRAVHTLADHFVFH